VPPTDTTTAPPTETPTSKVGLGAKIRYRFDLALSRGPSVVISWLGLLTLGIIAAAAVVLTVFRITGVNDGGKLNPLDAFWQSLLRVLDSGTFAGDTHWPARLIGLGITLAGIFIAGSLIGLIANAVDQRIEELRKGRSHVIENDHTVILGWSNRVPAIVSELVVANESRKHAAVVILASEDKTELEEILREAIPDTKSTQVVCRSGEPWLPRNLDLVNLATARSIVVIGGGNDAATVKVLLAVRVAQEQAIAAGATPGAHIVAEVTSTETAASLEALLGDNLVTVSSDDVVAELTAQACRQRGLSSVFRELLDFDGDELYFAPFPELVGKPYRECQMSFEAASVMGIYGADGVVTLNPDPDRQLATGDQLIAVVEDDSAFLVKPLASTPKVLEVWPPTPRDGRRRIVIVGWSDLGPRVVEELDEFLGTNTTVEILIDPEKVDAAEVRSSLHANSIQVEVTETSEGPEVVAEHAARVSFHEVIVLGYRDGDPDEADARTLLTLLAFRRVRQEEPVGPVRMVAELLDQRHAPLAVATGADDFIVSDELTSLMLAQLSENRELSQVFVDLFDRTGCSIELREALQYGAHKATCFGDVVLTASTLGHSAIGYRRTGSGEVKVNPAKSTPLSLTVDDEIIVVAPGIPAA
jgi:hypothetical protein